MVLNVPAGIPAAGTLSVTIVPASGVANVNAIMGGTLESGFAQGDVAAWFGSLPAVPAACTGSELLGAEGCKTNGFDNFDKIAFWKTPQAQGGKFVPYSRWTQDYIAIMGGR